LIEVCQITLGTAAGNRFAMWRQGALKLPANLTVLAEKKNAHFFPILMRGFPLCHPHPAGFEKQSLSFILALPPSFSLPHL
jgi:hypothetical protein